jgi:hypothetical protein
MAQDGRRAVLEEYSHHIAIGLRYLPNVARRLRHGRELGEAFDFLTWSEYVPEDSAALEELVQYLRATPEWQFVDREVDIGLSLLPTQPLTAMLEGTELGRAGRSLNRLQLTSAMHQSRAMM